MSLEPTSVRIWKRLSPADRLAAAGALWAQPPTEVLGAALGVIVKARHLRPQAARALKPEEQARILASVLDPGEPVSSALLVTLHLAARRPLLVTFLDAVGLPHEDGVLKEEADALPPLGEAKARRGRPGPEGQLPRRSGTDVRERALAAGSRTLAGAREEPRLAGGLSQRARTDSISSRRAGWVAPGSEGRTSQ